jgi:hypothetical protein
MTQKLDVTAYMKSAHWLRQYEIEGKKDGIHNKKTGELLVSFPFEIDPATAVLPSAPSSEGKSGGKAAGGGKQETDGKAGKEAGKSEGESGKEEQGGKPKPPKAGSEGAEGRGSEELPQPPSPPQPQQPPRSGEEASSP